MNLAQIVVAVSVAFCGLVSVGAWWQVRKAERALVECQAQRDGANRSVLIQNTRIDTWKEAAAQAQQQGTKALAAAVATTASSQGELRRLRASRPTTCEEAVKAVREGMQ